jgi:hypothetical protein
MHSEVTVAAEVVVWIAVEREVPTQLLEVIPFAPPLLMGMLEALLLRCLNFGASLDYHLAERVFLGDLLLSRPFIDMLFATLRLFLWLLFD